MYVPDQDDLKLEVDMLERALEPFQKAYDNDLKYIREFIQKNPHTVDHGCPANLHIEREGLATTVGKLFGSFSGFVLLSATFPPALIFFAAAELGLVGYMNYQTMQDKNENHQNWRLLDFAAKNGAIDVALYLIGKGANTEDKSFMVIAKLYGHESFINRCASAIARANCDQLVIEDLRDQNQLLQNQNNRLLTEVDLRDHEIAVLKSEIRSWEKQYADLEVLVRPSEVGFYSRRSVPNDNNAVPVARVNHAKK